MNTLLNLLFLVGVVSVPLAMGRPLVYLKEAIMYTDPNAAVGNISLFNNAEVTIYITFKKIIKSMKIHMFVSMKRGSSRFHHVLNETFDYCDTKAKFGRNQVWGMIYSTLPPNVPKTCPIPASSLVIQNYSFPSRFLPLKFPKMNFEYRIDFLYTPKSGLEKVLIGFNGTGKVFQ